MENSLAVPDICVFRTPDVPAKIATILTLGGQDVAAAEFSATAIAERLTAGVSCCVILWQRPESTLATALRTGGNPGPGLVAWRDRANEILALFRRNRSRVVLVNSAILIEDGCGPDRRRLEQRLEQSADGNSVRLVAPPAISVDTAPLSLADFFARLAAPRLGALQAVLREMEISSFTRSLSEVIEIGDLQEIAPDIPQKHKDAALEMLAAERDGLRDKVDLLVAQIRQMDGPLRDSDTMSIKLRQKLEQETQTAKTALNAQRGLAVSLEQRLFRETARSAELEEQVNALQIAVTALQAERAVLEADNRKFMDSQSWRVTAPLRKIRSALN